MVQCLRLWASNVRAWVRSLVWELRSHMRHSVARKKKKIKYKQETVPPLLELTNLVGRNHQQLLLVCSKPTAIIPKIIAQPNFMSDIIKFPWKDCPSVLFHDSPWWFTGSPLVDFLQITMCLLLLQILHFVGHQLYPSPLEIRQPGSETLQQHVSNWTESYNCSLTLKMVS